MMRTISIAATVMIFGVVFAVLIRGPSANYLTCATLAAHRMTIEGGVCKDVPGQGILLEAGMVLETVK